MKCSSCHGKGYHESSIAKDACFRPMITRCPNPSCPFIDKYYDKIKDNLSEGEQVVPNDQDLDKILKSSDTLPGKITIHIDPSLVGNPDALVESINEQLDQVLPDNPQKPLGPNQARRLDRSTEGPSNASRQEVEMDTEYPHLPIEYVQQVKQLQEADPTTQIMVTTPFGPIHCEKLGDANRVMGILNSYWKHDKELAIADETDNVIIFPLGRALGF